MTDRFPLQCPGCNDAFAASIQKSGVFPPYDAALAAMESPAAKVSSETTVWLQDAMAGKGEALAEPQDPRHGFYTPNPVTKSESLQLPARGRLQKNGHLRRAPTTCLAKAIRDLGSGPIVLHW